MQPVPGPEGLQTIEENSVPKLAGGGINPLIRSVIRDPVVCACQWWWWWCWEDWELPRLQGLILGLLILGFSWAH